MTDNIPALTKENVKANPTEQFQKWYEEAVAAEIPEVEAMALATATKEGAPSARIVLLKSFDQDGFVFYTNYESRKAKELTDNALACLLFYWMPVKRQVRIEGTVEKVSAEESEKYFHSRPFGSKLGAWASNQSEVIPSREELEKRFEEFSWKFGDNIPRPSHWGGYRLRPKMIEFWQGRENRLHDRLRYRLQPDGRWVIERLGP
jgi:pyridoxamine 5'-phosphate oxidase